MILNKIVDLHTLHIYVHPSIICWFFCPYVHIFAYCNCLLYSERHIYCVIILLSHLFWVYHVCALVCAHMCIYVYIYTFLPTNTVYVHTSMYTCAQFLTHPQAFINTHSFISMLIVHCLCVMLSFNMYTPVPVSVLICYDCECACAEYFFTVYISFKRSMLSETPQFADSSQCSQEAFDATDNAIFLSTLDEPSFFWKCFDIFVVLLRVAVLMCNYLLSCACFLYCVYMHVSFTPVPVPLHFSFI